ncbi:MAG TPA: TlyA family RNA methyltransferase [Acidobacteriaceae bacterium]|jgi:23S rRNA (cytidine1920-2'-O)/16S rRNA (cytidine1409-2'-O)-methyltransferase|nr:TlyA family RNA methyltransferase [Acidobacteriaceae bacterium]
MKIRLDKVLVERQLAPTRERAQALILAGRVLVSEQKIDKPGHSVAHDAPVRLLGGDLRYVSRGGLKLEAALAHWHIDLQGRFCCDIGASTGGFTDCMLQHGAARVLAIDTGYGQIAQTLRDHPRVTLMERTNARLLAPGALPAGIAFLSIDVSFISATLVLPAVLAALRRPPDTVGHGTREASLAHRAGKTLFRNPQSEVSARPETSAALKGHDFSRAETTAREAAASAPEETLEAVILIKPQFEAGRQHIGKGGIVRDPAAHQLAIDRVRACVAALGAHDIDVIDSPITGAEGNREFLLHARWA